MTSHRWVLSLLLCVVLSTGSIGCEVRRHMGDRSADLPIDLTSEVTYLVDESDRLGFDEVRGRTHEFRPVEDRPPDFGYSDSPYWFRVRLSRSRLGIEGAGRVVLVVDTEKLAFVEMYHAGMDPLRAGNTVPARERWINHRANAFPIDLDRFGETDVYFKVRAATSVRFPLYLQTEQAFFEASFIDYLWLGLFLGAMLVMAGYNLFLAFALKKSAYFFYSLYTLALTVYVAYHERLLLQFGLTSGYDAFSSSMIFSLIALTAILFFRSYLETRTRMRRLDRFLVAQALISGLLMFTGLVFDNPVSSRIVTSNVLLVVISWVVAIVIALRDGYRPARYMALAMAVTMAVGLATTLAVLGAIDDFGWRMAATRTAITLDVLILSLGLADLYRELQRERTRDRVAYLQEKERLIRDVHDNVATEIHSALISLPPGIDREPRRFLVRALENARDLASLIRLSNKTEQTLGETVDAYLANLSMRNRYMIEHRFESTLDRLPMQIRMQLYRMFQEWMSNALRHGGADRFKIEFLARPARVILRIRTNGAAFAWRSNTGPETAVMGSGLSSIRFRCGKIGARARAMSGMNGGSAFVLMAPRKDEA